MFLKTKATFFLAATLALSTPLAHAQVNTAEPQEFPQVQGTFSNSNIRACEPNYPVVGLLSGRETFYVINIERRSDGFEYYEIVSADPNDPYAGCVRSDAFLPMLDPSTNLDEVRVAIDLSKVPTPEMLSERWQQRQGLTKVIIPLTEGSIGGGGVPDAYTQPQIDRIREIADAQGIETLNPLVISNGRTGEALEYAVVATDSEGNPLYYVGVEDNKAYSQAPVEQASYVEAYANPPAGTLAWQFSESGMRLVAVNERNQVIQQFDMESEQWVEVEVPEFDILTEDEMQVVMSFLEEEGITGGMGPTIDLPQYNGLLKDAYAKAVVVVGKLSKDKFVALVLKQDGQKSYYRIYDDGSFSIEARYVRLKEQLAQGQLSRTIVAEGSFIGVSTNYDRNPALAERVCEIHNRGSNELTCKEFIAFVGMRDGGAITNYGFDDVSQLIDTETPLIALAGFRSIP